MDSESGEKRRAGARPCKSPRRIGADYLERAALHYLERYASSAANLRRVLMRKVERSARYHGDDPAEGTALVEDLVARYVRAGLLDDRAYAEAKTRSLHRRGDAARAIRGKLLARGVGQNDIDAALAAAREEAGASDPEAFDLQAAIKLSRRRRLGPWREAGRRAGFRERDMAVLGRAGFAYDIARRIVEAEDPETLEREAGA